MERGESRGGGRWAGLGRHLGPCRCPLAPLSGPPRRALSSQGPAARTLSTSLLALQLVPLCRQPHLKSQAAALAMLGPQPIGGDGGTMGKTCHCSVPADMGGQWGKRRGETCSEHTQPSNQGSAEVPGGMWVVKCPGGEGWGGPGNACWGQDAKAVCMARSSSVRAIPPKQPPRLHTKSERRKKGTEGGREGGRTNTGDTSLSPGARRRPAARLIVSSVAAATKECRLPHPYPRRLNNHLTQSLLHG